MIPTRYLDQVREMRHWADDLLPVKKRVEVRGSQKYAEFRRAVLLATLRKVNPDPGLVKLMKHAKICADGKGHIPTKKLSPRRAMTLSFLKMALFGARDVSLDVLFGSYAQQLGTLVMVNKKLWKE